MEEVATEPGTPRPRAATFHEVFQVAEFRALFAAHLLSLLGDQLAKVALAVLVYSRTSSPLLTAVSYALGYLPWLVGGPLLATVADLLPRRRVMVACDLARCLLVLGMAAAVDRLPVLLLLMLLVGLLAPPFEAARAATVPDVLRGDRYVVGTAVGNMVSQSSQALGFAAGGVLVAVVSPRGALALNAATFLGSAVLVQWGTRLRPAVAGDAFPRAAGSVRSTTQLTRRLLATTAAGARATFGSESLRSLVLLAWAGAAFGAVPEGLAAPYAAQLGGGPATVGVLMAAGPAGVVVGMFLLARFVAQERRLRLMRPLAVAASAALIGCLTQPGLAVTLVLWFCAGLGMSYQLVANAAFVSIVPPQIRARAFGVAQSGLHVAQGVAIVVAGAAAQFVGSATTVGLAGGLGVAAIAAIRPRAPDPPASAPGWPDAVRVSRRGAGSSGRRRRRRPRAA